MSQYTCRRCINACVRLGVMVAIASQTFQITNLNRSLYPDKRIISAPPLADVGIEDITRSATKGDAANTTFQRRSMAVANLEENVLPTDGLVFESTAADNSTITSPSSTGEQETGSNQSSLPFEQQPPVSLGDDQIQVINVTSSTATNGTSTAESINSTDPIVSYWTDDDPLVATMNRSAVQDFERQERVVIATKVQGDQEYQIADVKQSMCLLTAAYNNRVHYDIVVFTSHPWEEADVKELETIVAPANVKIVMDSLPLPDVVRAMSESGRQKLLDRCYNVTTPEDFHWHMMCDDGKLRYNWQAEFRTKHVWTNPALVDYKYMLWMDSDGHAGAKWKQDPIATMIRNELVLLFDNFPGGTSRDNEVRERIHKAFNTTVHCGIGLEDGHLTAYQKSKCILKQVHGFFHVTNLDFYRSPPVQHWVNTLIGDDHYRRVFDDQIGITVPAAILAPTQSWDMYSHDIKLKVVHNRFFDGKRGQVAKGYIRYWNERAKEEFPEAHGTCDPYIKSQGR